MDNISLKSFLFFNQIFLRTVQVSYKQKEYTNLSESQPIVTWFDDQLSDLWLFHHSQLSHLFKHRESWMLFHISPVTYLWNL